MRILRLTIENWRGIGRTELGFDERITIIHGPNETGKSTVQEAIRLGFLGEASSQATELKEIVPWGSSAKAHVEIVFETSAGERLRIEKSFPKGDARIYRLDDRSGDDAASLESGSPKGGRAGERSDDRGSLLAEGRGVQQKVFEYLSIPADASDLFSLLWVGQGESLSLFGKRPNDSPLNGPAQTLVKSVIKENLLSGPAEVFYRELETEYGQTILKNGRPKKGSRLGELEEREGVLAEEVRRLAGELAEIEESTSELAGIEERLAEAAQREAVGRERLEQLKRKQEASARVEPKRAAFERREERYQSLLGVEVREERSSARVGELLARKSAALEALKRELDERVGRASVLEKRTKELETVASAAPVSDRRVLDELEERQRKIREQELRLEASGLTMRIDPASAGRVSLVLSRDEGEGEAVDIESPGEWSAARTIEVTLPTGPKIECSGPLSREEWSSITTRLESERTELVKRLEKLECASVDEAKAAYDSYLAGEQERARIAAELAGIVGQGFDADRREVESAAAELAAEQKELVELGFGEPLLDGKTTPGGPGEGPAESLRRASRELSSTIRELQECRSQRDALLTGESREEFSRLRLAMKEELEHELERVAGMEPTELGTVTSKETNEEQRRIDEIARRSQEIAHRRTELTTILSRSGGLVERHEQRERQLSITRDELAAERQRIESIALLLKLIDDERAEIDRNIVEPLKERLTAAFREVVGDRYTQVAVNDQLGIGGVSVAVRRDELAVGNEALSYGTREQLSFVFRLLLAEYLSEREPQIMILDDTFVNTDRSRRERLFQMIEETPDLQFLLFTCHGDDYAGYRTHADVALLDLQASLEA